MNKEQKDKWLVALRSGEYKQTRNVLIRDEKDGSRSYCCLGVLDEITKDENPEFLMWGDRRQLTPSIMSQCVTKNDNEKLSFLEIADWLETTDLDLPIISYHEDI